MPDRRPDAPPPAPPRPGDPRVLAAVAAGGALGAVLRAALAEALPRGDGWPWATLVANIAGVALLAWVVTAAMPRRVRLARPLLGTGLCGALTTFSTMQVELVDMVRDGRPASAGAYLLVSLVLAAAAVAGVVTAVRGR